MLVVCLRVVKCSFGRVIESFHTNMCVLCLSPPDIVFFIFLYQRWIYRVDPKRVNEFGTSGEDTTPVEAEAEGNALEERPGDHSSEQGSKSAVDKKQD